MAAVVVDKLSFVSKVDNVVIGVSRNTAPAQNVGVTAIHKAELTCYGPNHKKRYPANLNVTYLKSSLSSLQYKLFSVKICADYPRTFM